ncbi:hypothetical protein D2N39_00120 [Gemmobacter lutimaris]|uniref:Anti-sigma K factor RskA C-terminal domain-containing protein n=1 Tax=Gemmobacter lutimaris TaxID=2306023 RepID=A0A398BUI3_9RHOB|nr:anti-sigma factor [Gemmobacter lutimaris]RID93374.1 hypothetical protein D2N39_00120 [Gemmobacter lutimaris]
MNGEDRDIAGEYVLGTLPHAERLAFAARLKSDPTLQVLVAEWEDRLAGLNAEYAESPAPDLFPAIEARLFPRPAQSRWQGWLGGLVTAAAVLLGAVVLPPLLAPVAPPVIAELGAPDAGLRFEAHYDGRDLILRRVAGAAPAASQSHELWIIAPDAAPVSLGLIGADPLRVAYPAPLAGWTLAVTLEPAGGAPQGIPTGPIVAAGQITL